MSSKISKALKGWLSPQKPEGPTVIQSSLVIFRLTVTRIQIPQGAVRLSSQSLTHARGTPHLGHIDKGDSFLPVLQWD